MSVAPPQVAFLIDSLGRGGAEQVVVALANALDPRRFGVHVITTRAAGPLAAALAPHVALHALDRRARTDVAAIPRLARLLADERVHVVCAHSHTAAFFALASRPFGRAWRLVMHDHHPPIAGAPVIRALDRLLLRRAAHYFTASAPLAAFARERIGLAPARVEWLPNGVVVPPDAAAARAPADVLRVAHVARFFPEKDQRLALDVVERLIAMGVRVRWQFLGRDATDYGRLVRADAARRGLDGAVAFLGERDDVRALLREADVGVLTSRAEALPIALLEYMAAALPVVVTDVGDCRAVVPAAGGAVLPSGDAAGLAAAIAALGSDAGARRAAGEANLHAVRARFTVDAMARRVADVFERLCAEAPRLRPR